MIDKKAFHTVSYGLYIIEALDGDGRKVGCIANTFQQVASNPPTVSIALNKDNATSKAIRATGVFSVSVLSINATMELIGRFGFKSSYDIDKYEGISYELWDGGVPYVVEDCIAAFETTVQDTLDVGSHLLFVGAVTASRVLSDDKALTYEYYHSHLKGKTPPRAVTYIEETSTSPEENETRLKQAAKDESSDVKAASSSTARIGWRCTICGYIYEGEELPLDFTCPICGAGVDFFERIEL